MKLHHDPRQKMTDKKRERFDALHDNVMNMDSDELDTWLANNVKNTKDMQAVMKKLILAVAALR